MNDLANKTILITGVEGTIGKKLSESFIEAGSKVYGTDKIRKNFKPNNFFEVDFVLNDSFSLFQNWLDDKQIDVLINCAGSSNTSESLFDLDIYDSTMEINLRAPFKICGVLISASLKSSRALSIINITSLGAHQGFPKNPSYQISKAGLSQLAKSISVDFSQFGIRANNIVPGYIKSTMTINSYNDQSQNEIRKNRSAMKRWGDPQDLVGAAQFLASNKSSFVTGIDLFVDGGWNINGI